VQVQNGRARQVRLTGRDEEYRPNSISPHETVQIPVAYTIGGRSSARSPRRVQSQPLKPPAPAFRLGGQAQMLPPNHPMHPANLRRRIMGQ
jgi:hypothetical protein